MPFCLLSSIHAERSSFAYPLPLRLPDTQKQFIKLYPSAFIGCQAFSAGIYSIKHFPRASAFKNTSPFARFSLIYSFFEQTCGSLFFEIAQQICSDSKLFSSIFIYSIKRPPFIKHMFYNLCFDYTVIKVICQHTVFIIWDTDLQILYLKHLKHINCLCYNTWRVIK